jgi:hypothetical protein
MIDNAKLCAVAHWLWVAFMAITIFWLINFGW